MTDSHAVEPGSGPSSTDSDADGLARALEVVGARWALLIVRELGVAPKRFGDLQRALGTPTNMLTTRLRELSASGVVRRVPMAHNVLAYALTDRGRGLLPAIQALSEWGADG